MRTVETTKYVIAFDPVDISGSAQAGDWICLRDYTHVVVLIEVGAGATAAAVTLDQATSSTGAGSKTLGLSEYWLGGATDALTKTTVTSDTFNITTASRLHVIEVDAADLDQDNDFDWMQIDVAASTASKIVGATYILMGCRYKDTSPPTAIA